MQRFLVVVITVLLLATVGARAGAAWLPAGTFAAADLTEPAQFKKKGKGFKKGRKRFAKGGKAKGKKGPHCFSVCISKGNPSGQCNKRCQ